VDFCVTLLPEHPKRFTLTPSLQTLDDGYRAFIIEARKSARACEVARRRTTRKDRKEHRNRIRWTKSNFVRLLHQIVQLRIVRDCRGVARAIATATRSTFRQQREGDEEARKKARVKRIAFEQRQRSRQLGVIKTERSAAEGARHAESELDEAETRCEND